MQKIIYCFLMWLFFVTGTSYGYYYTTTYVPCSQTYWLWAISNWNWTCTCMNWYVWWRDLMWNLKCVDANQACRDQYWTFSQSIWNWYCWCMKWYEFEATFWWKQCVSKASKCNKIMNATYNYVTETCTCRNWYVFDWTKCKQDTEIIVYLKEAKWTEAIIYNAADRSSFKLTLWSNCSFLYNDVWKYVTIDHWFDDFLNNWDTIYYSYGRTCTIRWATKVSNETTLQTCAELYWNWSIPYWEDKCTCKDWFKWNVWKTKCVEDSAYTYNKWAKNDGLSTTTTNGVYENTTYNDYSKALSAKRALWLDAKKVDELIPSFNRADPETQRNLITALEWMKNDTNTYNKNFATYFLYAIEHWVIE